ncbi:IS91 family transposase [Plebeiibacterium sediminum]|uniref:IS91 family transposase n=1 Tax=Plebeiibacterium sediminum TaxID=2992112 RepID=A0AAE3SHK7_9BACT|nr:IS91 family transposase [Plebeiobacterium sediminum]MCW3789718.1 IS91 family transposase [Plebeiobacterium sediminum]
MSNYRSKYEIGDIIRQHEQVVIKAGQLNAHKKKVFTNLANCRTAVLGYHQDKCDNPDCGHEYYSYNSCRDRHCPKCNGLKKEKWLIDREADLLPIKYFHVVFTVPEQLNHLFIAHPEHMYKILFRAAWDTIKQFAADHNYLGAQTGMIALLHTWGQNLALHPHLHCIVPGGGLTPQGKWKHTKSKGKYLYPVKALSSVFRGKFCDYLIDLHAKGELELDTAFDPTRKYLHPFYKNNWVVYAKRPMYNSKQVLEYVARYSHRVAISNHRIKEVDNENINFSWINYKNSKVGVMSLSFYEFLRRFAMHILPSGFMKIRHYGFFSSCKKSSSLAIIRKALNTMAPESKKGIPWQELFLLLFGRPHDQCPKCKCGTMQRIASFKPLIRGSPAPRTPSNLTIPNSI